MRAILCMRPNDEPMTWEEFCGHAPKFSIAIDGYVKAGPRFDPRGPWANFNHHEEVNRLATRATCGQVLMAMRLGLYECFKNSSGPRANVFANDCDEDVCASVFLLCHPELVMSVTNPALNRFVGVVDVLDTTAGSYPYHPSLRSLAELAWIFEPYRRFRATGGLDRRRTDEFEGVVTDVEHRIMEFVAGRGGAVELDLRYERMGGGHDWQMIREVGMHGRTGAFADGVHAYVIVRERGDGRYAYTVGRVSPFIPFDVPAILAALDAAEGDSAHHWGGGDTIGGSPRATGSALTPKEVERIVAECVSA